MTEIDITALRALMEKATKGQVKAVKRYGITCDDDEFIIETDDAIIAQAIGREDALSIAAALNALPALLDAYERLQMIDALPGLMMAGKTINEARAEAGLPPLDDRSRPSIIDGDA